jgi:hypothetical protein
MPLEYRVRISDNISTSSSGRPELRCYVVRFSPEFWNARRTRALAERLERRE